MNEKDLKEFLTAAGVFAADEAEEERARIRAEVLQLKRERLEFERERFRATQAREKLPAEPAARNSVLYVFSIFALLLNAFLLIILAMTIK